MAFTRFALSNVHANGIDIRVRHGGSGPPLLLLHGCPQTHMMWGKIADDLARDFTVIVPDIRGYGGTSKPPSTDDSALYSKRTMALDAIALMAHFDFDRFSVAGHDRGGRIGYRLALDHPDRVERLSIIDIVPTGELWARADARLMRTYWHWAFLALPSPMPENAINAIGGETFFLRMLLGGIYDAPFLEPEALADYVRSNADPETVRAVCEDYRASAGIDRELDDGRQGQRVACPMQILWGRNGAVGQFYDTLALWSEWGEDVRGEALDSGHFVVEEQPDETLRALRAFFLEGRG